MDMEDYGDEDVDALMDSAGTEPGDSPSEEEGEDSEGQSAAATSALNDLAAALGVKVKDKAAALAAFRDLMRYC